MPPNWGDVSPSGLFVKKTPSVFALKQTMRMNRDWKSIVYIDLRA
jgi:hypothetical protein